MALFINGKCSPHVKGRLAIDRVHLVGVAGTGLRGMAGILSQRGLTVSGSEAVNSPVLEHLRERGVACRIGHRRENLTPETQLLLVSAAINEDNPEIQAARRNGIPVLKYAEFLGLLMREKSGIAIAGTHGKTTTTAMTAQALIDSGAAPSFIIGGDYPTLGGSSAWGSGKYFVAEACEFDRSFLNLYPRYAAVTNIEEDHLDYFTSLGDIQSAFAEFVSHVPEDGFLTLNADDAYSRFLAEHCACPVGRFSLQPHAGDWWAEDVRHRGGGVHFIAASRRGDRLPVSLEVPGIHNVKNSLAVIVLLDHLGIPLEAVVHSLGRFTGVKRRFEILIREPGVVIDDYAHHPTEIEMVVRAARATFARRKIRVVFQPHQYSRTYRFLHGFARVLALADEVVVTDVFAARDSQEDMLRINSKNLVDAVRKQGGAARYARGFSDAVDSVRRTFQSGDVLLCLGAGDITYLAAQLAEAIGKPVEEVA